METDETTLWLRAAETLLANGHSPWEAMDGANLVLAAHRRQRAAQGGGPAHPVPSVRTPRRCPSGGGGPSPDPGGAP
jgi:hypothetical protein